MRPSDAGNHSEVLQINADLEAQIREQVGKKRHLEAVLDSLQDMKGDI